MKENIHPKVYPVVFVDAATGNEIISRSTMTSQQTKEVDGVEHYVIRLDVSSHSHPFWTGQRIRRSKEGRVEQFNRRFKRKKKTN